MVWVRFLAAAWWLTSAAVACAGTLEGKILVPERVKAVTTANPYPGRAGSMSSPTANVAGRVTDAVIYLDHLATGDDSPLAATHRSKPRLSQQGQSFQPRVLAIAVGTTVEFPNLDPIYHNVFSLSPAKRFDLGKYPRGQSRNVTFTKPGLVNVFCEIHSDMVGYIMVVPHHGFTRPSPQGDFSLSSLPAGRYVLKAWHPDFGNVERTVEVPASGSVAVELRFETAAPVRAADF